MERKEQAAGQEETPAGGAEGSPNRFFEQAYPPDAALVQRMHRMFYPETLALVGASANPAKWGHRVLHSILSGGYPGRVIPVNPKGGKILGMDVAKSLDEIVGPIDLVLVAVPPKGVMAVLEDCVRLDVGSVFMITAGFSESDPQGHEREAEMHRLLAGAGIPFGGPNGQGITCTQANLCAQMFPIVPPKGGISLVTQSGNVGVSLSHLAVYHNIGLSKTISAGNEASLTTADYLDYLAQDQDTKVIAVYLEGADDGRRMLAAMTRAAKRKPVVVLKSGRTRFGARAAVSHTGALAGADRIYDGALRQAGVVRVYDLEELFDVVIAFATMPLPSGNRLALVTEGGGWGVLASDAAADNELDLAPLPQEVIETLDGLLPPRWSRNNPIDFVAADDPTTTRKTFEMLLGSDAYDAVAWLGVGYVSLSAGLVSRSPVASAPGVAEVLEMMVAEDEKQALDVLAMATEAGKTMVFASDAALSAQAMGNKALDALRRQGCHVYSSPERALRALGHLVRYATWRRRIEGAPQG